MTIGILFIGKEVTYHLLDETNQFLEFPQWTKPFQESHSGTACGCIPTGVFLHPSSRGLLRVLHRTKI